MTTRRRQQQLRPSDTSTIHLHNYNPRISLTTLGFVFYYRLLKSLQTHSWTILSYSRHIYCSSMIAIFTIYFIRKDDCKSQISRLERFATSTWQLTEYVLVLAFVDGGPGQWNSEWSWYQLILLLLEELCRSITGNIFVIYLSRALNIIPTCGSSFPSSLTQLPTLRYRLSGNTNM